MSEEQIYGLHVPSPSSVVCRGPDIWCEEEISMSAQCSHRGKYMYYTCSAGWPNMEKCGDTPLDHTYGWYTTGEGICIPLDGVFRPVECM